MVVFLLELSEDSDNAQDKQDIDEKIANLYYMAGRCFVILVIIAVVITIIAVNQSKKKRNNNSNTDNNQMDK